MGGLERSREPVSHPNLNESGSSTPTSVLNETGPFILTCIIHLEILGPSLSGTKGRETVSLVVARSTTDTRQTHPGSHSSTPRPEQLVPPDERRDLYRDTRVQV